MKIEKELYPVFVVDVCDMPYAMEYVLIGAESNEDLREHLPEIINNGWRDSDTISGILSGFDARVVAIEGMYTDRPYEVLDNFSYYE